MSEQSLSCLTLKDGTRYAGEVSGSYGHPEGFGWGLTAGGDRYAGQWHRGERNVFGCMMYATKGIYYGQLRRGQMQGAGVYTWADGSTYKGQFNAGMWHGSALFVTKSGTRFAGIPLTSGNFAARAAGGTCPTSMASGLKPCPSMMLTQITHSSLKLLMNPR